MSVNGRTNVDLDGATWLKAGDSPGRDSVEVALLADGHVGLRNGKDPDGHVLVFTPVSGPPSRPECRTASSTAPDSTAPGRRRESPSGGRKITKQRRFDNERAFIAPVVG